MTPTHPSEEQSYLRDRDLLEDAARAAGLRFVGHNANGLKIAAPHLECGYVYWNPLFDDGNVFRLLVCLRLCVDFYGDVVEVCWFDSNVRKTHSIEEPVNDAQDEREAARRAIVRAAAAIARATSLPSAPTPEGEAK